MRGVSRAVARPSGRDVRSPLAVLPDLVRAVARNAKVRPRVELPRAADDRVRRRHEVELQVCLQRSAIERRVDDAEEWLQLGGEEDAAVGRSVVERLDPEAVADEVPAAIARVVEAER